MQPGHVSVFWGTSMSKINYPVKVKVGVIVSHLAGERHGSGIVASTQYIFQLARQTLRDHKIEVELVEKNDGGDSGQSIDVLEQCIEEGCIAIIGPSSSKSMHTVLRREKFNDIAKIATFATASTLADTQRDDFFRVTMNDRERALRLIDRSQNGVAGRKRVVTFTFDDVPASYSDSLRNDVIAILREKRIPHHDVIFKAEEAPAMVPNKSDAVLFCSPSRPAVGMIGKLRAAGCKAPFYAFGANENFAVKEAVGMTVVVDSFRGSQDPLIDQHLTRFKQKFPDEREPSIPTMVGAKILIGVFQALNPDDLRDVSQARHLVKRTLREKIHEGITGKLSFDEFGEIVGRESIPLLTVVEKRGAIDFERERKEKNVRIYARKPLVEKSKKAFVWGTGGVGLVAALLTILTYFGG